MVQLKDDPEEFYSGNTSFNSGGGKVRIPKLNNPFEYDEPSEWRKGN